MTYPRVWEVDFNNKLVYGFTEQTCNDLYSWLTDLLDDIEYIHCEMIMNTSLKKRGDDLCLVYYFDNGWSIDPNCIQFIRDKHNLIDNPV